MFTSRDRNRMNIDDGPQSARQKNHARCSVAEFGEDIAKLIHSPRHRRRPHRRIWHFRDAPHLWAISFNWFSRISTRASRSVRPNEPSASVLARIRSPGGQRPAGRGSGAGDAGIAASSSLADSRRRQYVRLLSSARRKKNASKMHGSRSTTFFYCMNENQKITEVIRILLNSV